MLSWFYILWVLEIFLHTVGTWKIFTILSSYTENSQVFFVVFVMILFICHNNFFVSKSIYFRIIANSALHRLEFAMYIFLLTFVCPYDLKMYIMKIALPYLFAFFFYSDDLQLLVIWVFVNYDYYIAGLVYMPSLCPICLTFSVLFLLLWAF